MALIKPDDPANIIEFLEKASFLRLTNDVAFKAYFKANEFLLTSIITHFLPLPKGSKVCKVDVVNPELSPEQVTQKLTKQGLEAGKSFILDLVVKFERMMQDGRIDLGTVNVEMQATSDPYLIERVLVYIGWLYSSQLKKGESYDQLVLVYSLVFTTQNLKVFKGISDYYHVCNIRRTMPPEVLMSNAMCFIIVELGKFDKNVKQLHNIRESWCYLLKNSDQINQSEYEFLKGQGGDMAKAVGELWSMSQDEVLQEYIYALEKKERIRITAEKYARNKGFKEGIEKGHLKGRLKGREEGREEGHVAVALNMLKKGLDFHLISECTGLSAKDVEALKKKS